MSSSDPATVDLPTIETSPAPARLGFTQLKLATVLGYAFAIISAVLVSTKAVVVKLAYDHQIDAETLLALRMGASLPIYLALGAIATIRRRRAGTPMPSPTRIGATLAIGLLGYWFASYTDFIGLQWISATFERLILFTYPMFIVVFGWMFFGGRLHWGILPSFLCSYAGLAFVFLSHSGDRGDHILWGAAMVFAAALAYGLYQLLAKREIGLMGSELFTALSMIGASLGALAVFFGTHHAADLLVARDIFPHVLFLAVGATIIPSYFLNAALARISAEANGAIGMISPVATIALAAIVLGDPLSPSEMIGTALVVSGVAWFVVSERRRASVMPV